MKIGAESELVVEVGERETETRGLSMGSTVERNSFGYDEAAKGMMRVDVLEVLISKRGGPRYLDAARCGKPTSQGPLAKFQLARLVRVLVSTHARC